MLPEHTKYKAHIDAHVAAFGKPEVVSLADDTHVFHFERDGDLDNAQILFVNKNGNQFRLIRQESGLWEFFKFWEGKPNYWHHEKWHKTGLTRRGSSEIIQLAGVGPQGSNPNESLVLLPKGTTRRRKAVWRGSILDVRFDVDNDRFTISTNPNTSATFSGKLWLSQEAAAWCRQNVGATLVSTAAQSEVKQKDEEIMMELEGSDMWGMF